MSQNINLFTPAFRKERQVLTLNLLVVCLAVVLLGLAGAQAYFQREVAGLAEEWRAAETLLKAQRGYTDKLKAEAAARKASAELEAETARLEAELKQAREAMDALKGGVIGTQQGFAEYLRAFSRQSVNGLWLTGLSIDGGGEIEIRGRTMSAELVPGYIQRLNREKVLAGRSFARFEMKQPRPGPEKASPEKGRDKEAKAAPQGPRYLEFSLTTAGSAGAGTGSGKTP
jgi:hypothetical protein